jgi:hypothetical protein
LISMFFVSDKTSVIFKLNSSACGPGPRLPSSTRGDVRVRREPQGHTFLFRYCAAMPQRTHVFFISKLYRSHLNFHDKSLLENWIQSFVFRFF